MNELYLNTEVYNRFYRLRDIRTDSEFLTELMDKYQEPKEVVQEEPKKKGRPKNEHKS